MFDLNKTPTLAQGEVNPQDLGKENLLQVQANSSTSAAPKTLPSSSRNYRSDPSGLAQLLIMVQDLPNDHPSTPNLTPRLPSHTSAFYETPVTAWRGNSSAVPQNFATVTTDPGDGAPAVHLWPLSKHGRVMEVWARSGAGGGLPSGNQNQASQCQTTMDLDCDIVSDGESDSYKPRNSGDNSNSKASLVDLDNLPDETPVDLQYPWSPVQQEEAPLHTVFHGMSSENLQDSATKLPPMSVEEELRLREVAFHASFKFETQRCTPTARCRSCLAFCQTRLPKLRLPSLEEGAGTGGGLKLPEDCPPVLRNVEDGEGRQARKMARHGPKSKSSEYRGVTFYKRTGRWEAHIWYRGFRWLHELCNWLHIFSSLSHKSYLRKFAKDLLLKSRPECSIELQGLLQRCLNCWHEGAQAYLGASGTKEEAARAYDHAALLLLGPEVEINFKPESYKMEIAYLYKLSKEQLGIYLRRDSRGFGAQVSYPGVRHVKNFYEAMYGSKVLGTFAIEEDAARAVYKQAVRDSFESMASLILDTHHVRNMPSYAAQRFAALYPGVGMSEPDHSLVSPGLTPMTRNRTRQKEAVEGMQLRNQANAITSKRPSGPQRTSPPQKKKRSTRQARKPNQDSTSPPAAARAIAAPPLPGAAEQLPGNKVNEIIEESPNALTTTHSWDAYLAPKTRHRNAARINPMAAQHLESRPHQPSNGGTNTPSLQQLRNALPKFIRAPAATTASSSCHAPSVPSVPGSTGEAFSSGVIKFKLFNVEISVEEVQDHGSSGTCSL